MILAASMNPDLLSALDDAIIRLKRGTRANCVNFLILLVGYIYGDARRRGMRPVLWALLAFFIPNAIGIILYFILREPLLVNCPKCGAGTKSAFPFCPSCGSSLADTCPSCRSAIESGWSHCPRCGTPQTVGLR